MQFNSTQTQQQQVYQPQQSRPAFSDRTGTFQPAPARSAPTYGSVHIERADFEDSPEFGLKDRSHTLARVLHCIGKHPRIRDALEQQQQIERQETKKGAPLQSTNIDERQHSVSGIQRRNDENDNQLLVKTSASGKPQTPEIDSHKTFAELGFDSLDVVEVMVTIEREFGIEMTDELYEPNMTIDALVDFLLWNPVAK